MQTRKQVQRRPVSARRGARLLPPEPQAREGPGDRPDRAAMLGWTPSTSTDAAGNLGGHGGGSVPRARRGGSEAPGSDGTCSASPSKAVAEPRPAPSRTPNGSPVTHRPHPTPPLPPPRIPPAQGHAFPRPAARPDAGVCYPGGQWSESGQDILPAPGKCGFWWQSPHTQVN